jgi:hypothetical protein
MPATSADIAVATRPSVTASWSNSTIRTRYPTASRDGTGEIVTGHCDAIADAQVLVDAQGALIGTERRRFAVRLDGLHWIAPASTVTVIDAEQGGLSGPALVSRCAFDLEEEMTVLELFG